MLIKKRIISVVVVFALHVLWCIEIEAVDDEWWEYSHIYQVYPRSFQDSNGDGIGDINGIRSRLPYLKEIGVDAVWLSPIFKSPMKDFGYDISDFRDIHHEYGNTNDFNNLARECRALNLKLLLDFVPNHTSDQHVWFYKSSNPSHSEFETYKDYYVWNKGKLLKNGTRLPPSNWRSVFGGSAWRWSESRQAFYLHQFLAEQPDLNFRHKPVIAEMDDILRFWLKKGVAGFRVDAVAYLYEEKPNSKGLYNDEPVKPYDDGFGPEGLSHTKTMSQDETYDLVAHFHDVIKEFSDPVRILMTEAYVTLANALKYYGKTRVGKGTKYISEIPFNFGLQKDLKGEIFASDIKEIVNRWIDGMPSGRKIHANWVIGNHDNTRMATKFGQQRIDIFNILLKTLPGITFTYYGEEIGMFDGKIPSQSRVDKTYFRLDPDLCRDPCRTPMQWDNSTNAGFSPSKTWLPVTSSYSFLNVETQKQKIRSYLKVFQKLIELRKNPTMKYGELKIQSIMDHILVYRRKGKDDKADVFVVVINLGISSHTIDLKYFFNGLPNEMEISISSIHYEKTGFINTRAVNIPASVGLVLRAKGKSK